MSSVVTKSCADRPSESTPGIDYSLLLSGEATDGTYELMKFVAPPGAGPPPHVHRKEDESFLVIEGEMDVHVGEQPIHATGTFVHLPRGFPHRLENNSGATAVFLCWVTPANLGGFFDSFKRPWPNGPQMSEPPCEEDIGKMMAASAKHETHIMLGDPAPSGDSPH